jgi:hypothetical protein
MFTEFQEVPIKSVESSSLLRSKSIRHFTWRPICFILTAYVAQPYQTELIVVFLW